MQTSIQTAASAAVFLALGWLASPAALHAQTLRGFLLEGGTGTPVAEGVVGLYTPEGRPVGDALSDSTGAFEIRAPSAGYYFLTAEKIGYVDLTHGDFEIGAGKTVSFDIYLRTQPVELEGIGASVERTDPFVRRERQRLAVQGFFERMEEGFGDFFTPELIEERNPTYFSDIIIRLPGVYIDGGLVKFRGVTGMCEPNIWIDGILVFGGAGPAASSDEMRDIDGKIQVQQVSAVEVYRRLASTPIEYSIPNARCGTVLIWTR